MGSVSASKRRASPKKEVVSPGDLVSFKHITLNNDRVTSDGGGLNVICKALLGTLVLPNFSEFCNSIETIYETVEESVGGHVIGHKKCLNSEGEQV